MTDAFRTHTGELVTGPRLTAALASVASDWADMARAIRREDAYASHVTEADKDSYLAAREAVGLASGAARALAGQVTPAIVHRGPFRS